MTNEMNTSTNGGEFDGLFDGIEIVLDWKTSLLLDGIGTLSEAVQNGTLTADEADGELAVLQFLLSLADNPEQFGLINLALLLAESEEGFFAAVAAIKAQSSASTDAE